MHWDIESYPPISFVWRHIDSVVRPRWRSWQRWNSPRTTIWSVTRPIRTLFLVRRRSSSDQIRTMVVAVVMPHQPFRVPYCKWSCGESFVLSRVDTRNMGAKKCVCVWVLHPLGIRYTNNVRSDYPSMCVCVSLSRTNRCGESIILIRSGLHDRRLTFTGPLLYRRGGLPDFILDQFLSRFEPTRGRRLCDIISRIP